MTPDRDRPTEDRHDRGPIDEYAGDGRRGMEMVGRTAAVHYHFRMTCRPLGKTDPAR